MDFRKLSYAVELQLEKDLVVDRDLDHVSESIEILNLNCSSIHFISTQSGIAVIFYKENSEEPQPLAISHDDNFNVVVTAICLAAYKLETPVDL